MNVTTAQLLQWLVQVSYLVAATLFLLGLQRMASPVTARSGDEVAGAGDPRGVRPERAHLRTSRLPGPALLDLNISSMRSVTT